MAADTKNRLYASVDPLKTLYAVIVARALTKGIELFLVPTESSAGFHRVSSTNGYSFLFSWAPLCGFSTEPFDTWMSGIKNGLAAFDSLNFPLFLTSSCFPVKGSCS